MQCYQQKKSFYYFQVIFIYLIDFLLLALALIFFRHRGAYTPCLATVFYSFLVNFILYKNYKNPVVLTEKEMTITTLGQKKTVEFKNIMRIEYRGIPHSHIEGADSMVLYCGMAGKICVEAAYEDYLTLWKQIIENAKRSNPRLTINPKIEKRLQKG